MAGNQFWKKKYNNWSKNSANGVNGGMLQRHKIFFQRTGKNEVTVEMSNQISSGVKINGKYLDEKLIQNFGAKKHNGGFIINKAHYPEALKIAYTYVNGDKKQVSPLDPLVEKFIAPMQEVLKFTIQTKKKREGFLIRYTESEERQKVSKLLIKKVFR